MPENNETADIRAMAGLPPAPVVPSVDAAKMIADALTALGRKMGAPNVVVMVGFDGNGDHYIAWSGGGLAIYGLAEIGMQRVRTASVRSPLYPPTAVSGGGGGAGVGHKATTPTE